MRKDFSFKTCLLILVSVVLVVTPGSAVAKVSGDGRSYYSILGIYALFFLLLVFDMYYWFGRRKQIGATIPIIIVICLAIGIILALDIGFFL